MDSKQLSDVKVVFSFGKFEKAKEVIDTIVGRYGEIGDYYRRNERPNLAIPAALRADEREENEALGMFTLRCQDRRQEIKDQKALKYAAKQFTAFLGTCPDKALMEDIKTDKARWEAAMANDDFIDLMALFRLKCQPQPGSACRICYDNLKRKQTDEPFNGSWQLYSSHFRENLNQLTLLGNPIPDFVSVSNLEAGVDQKMFLHPLNDLKNKANRDQITCEELFTILNRWYENTERENELNLVIQKATTKGQYDDTAKARNVSSSQKQKKTKSTSQAKPNSKQKTTVKPAKIGEICEFSRCRSFGQAKFTPLIIISSRERCALNVIKRDI
jgi:hypothetical protein